jgi:thioredoxin-related protein
MQIIRTLLVVWILILPTANAVGAELVLFENEGCPWCEAWDRDVGKIYDLTDEARILTLRRVELHDPMPADLRQIEDIQYTPTFVVVDDGKEIGRILGYIGPEQFWGLLGEIIKKLPRTERSRIGKSS